MDQSLHWKLSFQQQFKSCPHEGARNADGSMWEHQLFSWEFRQQISICFPSMTILRNNKKKNPTHQLNHISWKQQLFNICLKWVIDFILKNIYMSIAPPYPLQIQLHWSNRSPWPLALSFIENQTFTANLEHLKLSGSGIVSPSSSCSKCRAVQNRPAHWSQQTVLCLADYSSKMTGKITTACYKYSQDE